MYTRSRALIVRRNSVKKFGRSARRNLRAFCSVRALAAAGSIAREEHEVGNEQTRTATVLSGKARKVIVKALDGKSTRINGIPAPNLGTIPRLKESQKLEDRDLEVLRLMSIGLIDTVAARSLAISLRTYRRRVAEIMKKLNVDSRFQAGVVVGQRGWLP